LKLSDIMTRHIEWLDHAVPLSEVAAAMTGAHISSVVLRNGDTPVGILTERDFLRLLGEGRSMDTPAHQVMSRPLYTVPQDMLFESAWARMSVEGFRHLLATNDQGVIVGMASETDFRNHLDATVLQRMGSLTSVMQQDLPVLPPDAPFATALDTMRAHHGNYVVVVKGGRALGVLTERDIPRLMLDHPLPGLLAQPLSALALPRIHTIDHKAWLSEAAQKMHALAIRHLVVEDEQGQLVGMLLSHDLMSALGLQIWQNQMQAEQKHLQSRTRMAEERVDLAASAALLGFWDFDAAKDRIDYSTHMVRLMGGDGTATANRPMAGFMAMIHRDQVDQVSAKLRHSLRPEGDGKIDVEYQVRGLDGQWRWVQTRGQVVHRSPEGKALRAVGVTMDIQKRKEQAALLEQLSHTLNRSPVIAVSWTPEPGSPIGFVSDNVRQWGYEARQWMAQRQSYESLIHPDDRQRVMHDALQHLAQREHSFNQSYRVATAEGHWRWIDDHSWVELDDKGQTRQVHSVLVDITVRKQLELVADIERRILERLVLNTPLAEVLALLIEGYEQMLPGMTGSILKLDPIHQTLHPASACRLPASYLQAIDGLAIGPKVGSCGTAAYHGKTVIVSNIACDELWSPFCGLAQQYHLQACWSFPIKGPQGKVQGTFAMYNASPREPLPHEIKALEQGAQLAGLAIERAHNEQMLRQLSLAVEQSSNSIVITDLRARIEYANRAFLDITGYTLEEALGQNPAILKSGKTPDTVYQEMWARLSQGHAWQGEFINRRKDGTEYVEAVRISPVKQASGEVTHYLAIKEDITQRKVAEQQIHRLAYFDTLTGLPNRQLLTDRFAQALSLAKRQGSPLTLMFIDLDHFKHVNDTLGHPAGDQLLIETTRRLSASVRTEDTLSRQGGDEFVLLLPNCGPVQAAQVAEKLMTSHAESVRIEGHDVTVTLSIGIALYPNDGTDFNSLSKAADVAMYRAKEEGRNTYRFFTTDMQVRSSRTLTLESHLRRALEKNELQLVYQPQVSLADGHLVGVEALVRWQHPTLGVVSPGEFIPMAESNGLILPIGEWVLRTAVQQAKSWMEQGMGKMVMAVNLSAVQFRHAGLSILVDEVLHEYDLPPECLELELTESVAMSDPLGAVVAMDEIGALGVRMAIDDFGTGYSSLSYLKRFKAAKLKIDRSFVQDITTDPDDKAIASAIIGLASSLGLRTIAEGVETPGQLAWLRMQGCDEAQGYLFSPPVNAEGLERWARSQGLIA
jgi:diguanylate cyclase (GGDEF)-like protein/PAS domain S-box-containing protein